MELKYGVKIHTGTDIVMKEDKKTLMYFYFYLKWKHSMSEYKVKSGSHMKTLVSEEHMCFKFTCGFLHVTAFPLKALSFPSDSC